MNLKRKHAAEGRTRSRLKHQFGSALDSDMYAAHVEMNQLDDLGEAIVAADNNNEDLVPTMRSLATQFHQDLLDDEDPPESDHENDELPQTSASTSETPLPTKIRLFFGTQVLTPLHDLFDHTPTSGNEAHGLDIFKSAGLANLQAELELYGLATKEMQGDLETDDTTDWLIT